MADISFDEMYTTSEDVVKQFADLDEHCTLMLTDAEKIDASLRQLHQCREEGACKPYAYESQLEYEQLVGLPANAGLQKISAEYELALSEMPPMQDTDTDQDNNEAYNRSFQLRERYLCSLCEALDGLTERIDKMADLFNLAAEMQGVVEENQHVERISMLTAENEKLRQQLTIAANSQQAAEQTEKLEESVQQAQPEPVPVEEPQVPVAAAVNVPIPMISPVPVAAPLPLSCKRAKKTGKTAKQHINALDMTEDMATPKPAKLSSEQRHEKHDNMSPRSKSSILGKSGASGKSYSSSHVYQKAQRRGNVCTASVATETTGKAPPVKEKVKRQIVKKNASTTTRKN